MILAFDFVTLSSSFKLAETEKIVFCHVFITMYTSRIFCGVLRSQNAKHNHDINVDFKVFRVMLIVKCHVFVSLQSRPVKKP